MPVKDVPLKPTPIEMRANVDAVTDKLATAAGTLRTNLDIVTVGVASVVSVMAIQARAVIGIYEELNLLNELLSDVVNDNLEARASDDAREEEEAGP